MRTWGYARVSTREQNLDRQLKQLDFCDRIWQEKQSGKDFDHRPIYQQMKRYLGRGDLLVICSIDRLGRNYEQIINEWQDLRKKEVDIQVLDMPLLNTKNNLNGLDGRFISDLVLQILSYVAQKEREKIKERQMEGIKIAKEKGVKFGRPKVSTPPNTNEILDQYINHKLTNIEAARIIGVSRGTFFRLVRERRKEKDIRNESN